MPKLLSIAAGAGLSLALTAGVAAAQDCATAAEDKWDIEAEEVVSLYDCIKDAMATAYAKNEHEAAQAYRGWAVTSTRPAIAGPHGERYLQTFANDIAAEEYLKFAYEGVEIPVGGVLAKESFNIRKGKAVVGPLFLMTKVGLDDAPETDGWLYAGVMPNGKDLRFKQAFCHDCHAGFSDQDFLAYPLEEVRIGAE